MKEIYGASPTGQEEAIELLRGSEDNEPRSMFEPLRPTCRKSPFGLEPGERLRTREISGAPVVHS